MISQLPILGITMGDPAGVGPEIIVKALSLARPWEICRPVVVGDPGIMERARAVLGAAAPIRAVSQLPQEGCWPREIRVLPSTGESLAGISWGELDPRCGRAQVDFIRRAVALAMEGKIHAVVTAPIHKKGLRWAHVPHPGHTEMLAEWTGAAEFAMMLAGEHLRVVPVTLHQALREAISSLTSEAIHTVIRLTHRALRDWFGFSTPRVAVAGLNPHAGDEGLFGSEEQEIIRPAVKACQAEGLGAEGPLPPDAVFRMAMDGRFDAVVAMYHDQGLIPLKLLDRDNAVNLTLGLPIIRTSVDHGTAYDIAGTGKASQGSLMAAMEMAARLARIKFDER
jgi:4-hydroxythreonine-4-phosphate dehydrogenase